SPPSPDAPLPPTEPPPTTTIPPLSLHDALPISPPAPAPASLPSLNNSKIVGSVPSPMQQLQPIAATCPPVNTPNAPASAAAAATLRLVSHKPGGFNGLRPPTEKPAITGLSGVPSRSIRQYSNTNTPDPSGRGEQPTSTAVPTGLLK